MLDHKTGYICVDCGADDWSYWGDGEGGDCLTCTQCGREEFYDEEQNNGIQ